MASVKYYLNDSEKSGIRGVAQKNLLAKRSIITYMAVNGACTLSDLGGELNMSIPTVTKLVAELGGDDIVIDYGKIETNGGRRPNLYGLAQSAIYFAGVDVGHRYLNFVVTDLKNNIIDIRRQEPFELRNTPECLDELCGRISDYIGSLDIDADRIMGIGVNLSGRINSNSGYSYYYFNWTEKPLSEILEERIGFRILIENDTRSSCYAEYMSGMDEGAGNVIYFYLSRGLAVGIIIDGKLYYGKSGFAGEFGHIPFFDNDILCPCGKKGCLETEVSGIALERQMEEKIRSGRTTLLAEKYRRNGKVFVNDILDAAAHDDVLSIELIEEMGEKAGRAIATLINLFNPEQLIVGGAVAAAGDYLMLPIKAAVNKYSLSLVNNDTKFSLSRLGNDAEVLGVAMLIRKKILGL